jgi:hypothetical protein
LALGDVLIVLASEVNPKIIKKILLPPWVVKGILLLEITPVFNLRLRTFVRNVEFRRKIPKTKFQEEVFP